MKSMTGYGRGEAARDGIKVTAEVSSVNRRQGEVQISLPRELEALDPRTREMIHRKIARGRVAARVTLETTDAAWAGRLRINMKLARAYATELRALSKALSLTDGLALDSVLRLPGVISSDAAEATSEAHWPLLEEALTQALALLVKAREREGAHLARDLKARITLMRRLTDRVRRRAPRVAADYRTALLTRIRSAGLDGIQADDDRLMKEVVLFADRSDITEELTRLESHFQQFDDCASSREAVGRMLDFLAQEMGREINTIGSKASDGAISRAVVTLKAELEKFREQAQNVE